MMPKPAILYAADGTEIRIEERMVPADWAVTVALRLALVLVAFLAGWVARGKSEPRIEWQSNGYDIGQPATPPTYFPPGGHRPIV